MIRWFPGHIPNQPACGRIRAQPAGFIFLSKAFRKAVIPLVSAPRMMVLEMYGRSCWNELIIKRSIENKNEIDNRIKIRVPSHGLRQRAGQVNG